MRRTAHKDENTEKEHTEKDTLKRLVCLTLIYLLEVYPQFSLENERTPHTQRKDKNQEPHFKCPNANKNIKIIYLTTLTCSCVQGSRHPVPSTKSPYNVDAVGKKYIQSTSNNANLAI